MKLRVILIILSLLAFLSAATAGHLYYSSSKRMAIQEADRQAALRTEATRENLSSRLAEYLKSAKALAGLEELRRVLTGGEHHPLTKVNALLDHFRGTLGVDVCYLMNTTGDTVASSNRNAPDSFVGENYAFRPYFRRAMRGKPAIYMALGITSKKRGVYYSHPVYGASPGSPLGVVVIKASIGLLEKDFNQAYEGVIALVDPHGIIFITNQRQWLFHFLWKPSPQNISQIALERQFGQGPWNWTGLTMGDETHAVDLSGNEYRVYKKGIHNYPGWSVTYLQNAQAIARRVSAPLIKMTGFAIVSICTLIGLMIFFLYRKASYHLTQRKAAEEAQRESEETVMALLNAPTEGALLLDKQGTILAMNKTAAERFGKSLRELIGSNAFDSFSPEVGKARWSHHEWVVRSGKPFRYEDMRDGRWLNTSLYPVFDKKGQVVRVAVFSRDVTDQKRAEEELKRAKEKLTQYSKGLEKRVRKRTREITSILKYTPAVVFIKDGKARYTLINSKFEELFRRRSEDILGKTDYEVFPKETADQFRASDQQVLDQGISIQVEDRVSHPDGVHTYLSVKFPLYDERGSVNGLCGIATDITALKKAEDRLRRLSGSIMTSQEKERTAIARELHDELGQMLTALRMDAVWIREHIKENDSGGAERALAMCGLIDKTIDEVRGMAIRLRPGVLDDLGLIAGLEWYTNDFEKRTGIACRFIHSDMPHVDNILATAAYRITQEALTNVARHSLAVHVDVSLLRQNGTLNLSIVDDGRGFDPRQLSESECLGIAGMRERAALVGGSLEIQFRPEKGTEICFRVPFQARKGGFH